MSPSAERLAAAAAADDPWGLAKAPDTPRPVATCGAPISAPVPPVIAPVAAPVIVSRSGAAPQTTWWMAVATAMVIVGLAAFAAGRESLRAAAQGDSSLGTLVLSSHPSGALVAVDGRPEGATPLALRLVNGAHAVVVTTAAGVSEQFTADVTAGASAARHVAFAAALPVAQEQRPSSVVERRAAAAAAAGGVPPVAVDAPAANPTGWITVSLPFDVQVYEGATLVGSNRGDRLKVSAGRHTFDLVNETLLFRAQQTISLRPGQTAQLAVDVPAGVLSVNAQPWADVTVDGRNYGETPLANISLPIGTHEVMLRHPTLGERREAATVRLGTPNRVSVDLRK
jgi:eukaryotic-like serine/threonine-protein kinase